MKAKYKRGSLRNNFSAFYVGALDKRERFRVEGVHYIKKDRSGQPRNGCWMVGDVVGQPHLRDVWVNCKHLTERKKGVPAPRILRDSELIAPGKDARRELKKRFASLILPGKRDGVLAKLRPGVESTEMFGDYNPRTGKFSDPPKHHRIFADAPNREMKVRYFSRDGNAAVIKHIIRNPRYDRRDPNSKRTFNQWSIVRTDDIYIPTLRGTRYRRN